jgi:hypothetical protein
LYFLSGFNQICTEEEESEEEVPLRFVCNASISEHENWYKTWVQRKEEGVNHKGKCTF